MIAFQPRKATRRARCLGERAVLFSLLVALFYANQSEGSWIERGKLVASDGAEGDDFGVHVAIADGLAIIGAWAADGSGINAGAAYLFDANPGSLTFGRELLKIKASDAAPGDLFGRSVAIGGGMAIVGAIEDTHVNKSGSAYLFDVDPASSTFGEEILKVVSPFAEQNGEFGFSTAVDGRLAIIGAREADCCGAAYLFDIDRGSPTFGKDLIRLTASDSPPVNDFGIAVALSGNRALVGAISREFGSNDGAAYLYDVNPDSPSFGRELAILKAPNTHWGAYGNAVALNDQVAVVGHIYDDGVCPGIDCNAGAANVFDINPLSPTFGHHLLKLTASDLLVEHYFGASLAISEGVVFVASSATVYGFDINLQSASFGQEIFKFSPAELEPNSSFRTTRIAADNGTAIVGAWGVNKRQGASYLFTNDSGIVGDTDGDGDVDIDDLNNVRNHFGQTGANVFGDTNGDQVVNIDDLNNVRNHFGESSAAVKAVPEPGGLSVALLALMFGTPLIPRRRKRRHERLRCDVPYG